MRSNTLTVTATSAELGGRPYVCANALTATGAGDRLDVTDSAVALQAPPPAPAPADPADADPAVAKLSVSVQAPRRFARGRWQKIRIRVADRGDARADRVRLRIRPARGVRVRPRSRKLELRPIAAGEQRTAEVSVRLGRRAGRTAGLRVIATAAGGLRAADRVVLRTAGRERRDGDPDGSAARRLVGRYFWDFRTSATQGWENTALAFVNRRFAYRGFPEHGLPRCRRVTATKGEDGCVRYRYDRQSGRLIVGGRRGSYRDGELSVGQRTYERLAVPDPGARLAVQLIHRNFFGICIVACTTVRKDLVLTRDGRFVLSGSSLSSVGGPGSSIESYFSSTPPDEHGSYRILSRGRIRLRFADGNLQTRTIGIQTDRRGRPRPAGVGLLLNDINFYVEDD